MKHLVLACLCLAPLQAHAGLTSAIDARTTGLLRFIGALEAPRGYNDYYRGVSTPPPHQLVSMTLSQVLGWQHKVTRNSISGAAGRYQFMPATLQKLMHELGLTGSMRFDARLQDRLAVQLLRDAGWRPSVTPSNRVGTALAAVWAALPIMEGPAKGLSVYEGIAGNRALTTPTIYRRVLAHPSDPAVIDAAIAASRKAPPNGFHKHYASQRYALVKAFMKMGNPTAFNASVIRARTQVGRLVVFTADPFAVN